MARPRATDSLSVSELQTLINSRKLKIRGLRKERRQLAARLARIDRELAIVGGVPGASLRPRNDKNLVDVIADVMGGAKQPMGVGEVTDAVLAAGYRSSSANFKGIVNQTLIKERRFTSPERGLYQLKR